MFYMLRPDLSSRFRAQLPSMSPALQSAGLVLLAAVLLQTIAVTVTFIFFSGVLSTTRQTFAKSSVSCLMRAAGGDGDPCWRLAQQLHFLVEKSMSKEMSSAVKGEVSPVLPSLVIHGTDDSSPPEIAAHVTGSYVPQTEQTAGVPDRKIYGQKIQFWESEKGLAFLQNVELSEGELVVPQTGLYYIYSQTYFKHTLIEEEESDEEEEGISDVSIRGKPMLQYVYKKVSSYPVPVLLMKNAQTTCWSRDTEYGLYSIYQAGVFQLGAGDRVFVTVSNVSAIDMDEKSSFFGAFLVS